MEFDKGIFPLLASGWNVHALRVVKCAHRDGCGGRNRAGAQDRHRAGARRLELGSVVEGADLAYELNQVARHEVLDVWKRHQLVLCVRVDAHDLHSAKCTRGALRRGVHDKEEGTVSALNRTRRNLRKIARSHHDADGAHDLAFEAG